MMPDSTAELSRPTTGPKQCNCSGRSGGSARTGTGTGTADRPSCTARAQSQHSSEKPRRSSRPPVARWSAYCQAPGPVSGSTRRECLRAQLRPRCSQRHGGGRAGRAGASPRLASLGHKHNNQPTCAVRRWAGAMRGGEGSRERELACLLASWSRTGLRPQTASS